jgi:hypothetical protein
MAKLASKPKQFGMQIQKEFHKKSRVETNETVEFIGCMFADMFGIASTNSDNSNSWKSSVTKCDG